MTHNPNIFWSQRKAELEKATEVAERELMLGAIAVQQEGLFPLEWLEQNDER